MADPFDGSAFTSFGVDLGDLTGDTLALATAATTKVIADMSGDAKAFAPYDTGNLRNSIGFDVDRGADYVDAEMGPTAAYGRYVEDGTSRKGPAAYVGPAFDRRAPEFVEAMDEIVSRFPRG